MEKIKSISERIQKTPEEFSAIQLLIAKSSFILFAILYFHAFLFTIGGFAIGPLTLSVWSLLLYYLFPVFSFSCCWFVGVLGAQMSIIWFDNNGVLKYTIYVFCFLVWLMLNLFHLNILSLTLFS